MLLLILLQLAAAPTQPLAQAPPPPAAVAAHGDYTPAGVGSYAPAHRFTARPHHTSRLWLRTPRHASACGYRTLGCRSHLGWRATPRHKGFF